MPDMKEMTFKASCGYKLEWHSCYSGNYDLWNEEAYSHPAKMAPGLCFRIFEHLKELGLIDSDSIIMDPLAGIGTTGLIAGSLGLTSIMVELEDKFYKLSQKNREHLEKQLGRAIDMKIVQGDSRVLSRLLEERGLCCIVSPPYINSDKPFVALTSPPYEAQSGGTGESSRKSLPRREILDRMMGGTKGGMGKSEGNISNEQQESYTDAMLKVYSEIIKVADTLAVVIKDPTRNKKLCPLGEITIALMEQAGWHIHCIHKSRLFEDTKKLDLFGTIHKKPRGRISFFKLLSHKKGSPIADHEKVIIATREGKGMKAICSPPYSDLMDFSRHGDSGICGRDPTVLKERYGNTPGQIGNLK